MPPLKRLRAEAERLGIQTIRTVADGRTVRVARSVCAACEGHDQFRPPADATAADLQATFEARGWTGFGRRPLCPSCSRTPRKPEDSAMLPRQKITRTAMDQMPAPTARQVVAIADALAEHLDDGRYRPGWSDHRVGDALTLPAALVAKVREDLHGPLKGDPEIEAFRSDLDAWMSIGADLRDRLDHLEQTRP